MRSDLCSVWSWHDRRFHYYAPPVGLDEGDRRRRKPTAPIRARLGDPPDRLLDMLPLGSQYLGSGEVARGHIVVVPSLERDQWGR